jgi:hypothetical protein
MYLKIFLAVLLAVTSGAVSCEKLAADGEGPLPLVTNEIMDGIDAKLGRFVAVTPHPTEADAAALWFEQDDGTISVVWVNVAKRTIHTQVLKIPRKS